MRISNIFKNKFNIILFILMLCFIILLVILFNNNFYNPPPNPPNPPPNPQTDDSFKFLNFNPKLYSIITFTTKTSLDVIKNTFNNIINIQGGNNNKWGNGCFGILFSPGIYDFKNWDIPLHFYTSIRGLGNLPSDTIFKNCNINIQGFSIDTWENTTNIFWRDVENIQIDGNIYWYTSQACPLRRIIAKQIPLNSGMNNKKGKGSWASGGFISDIKCDIIKSGNQQQFCIKNIECNNIQTGGMNFVIINSNVSNKQFCNNSSAVTIDNNNIVYPKPWLLTNGIAIPNKSTNNTSNLNIEYTYLGSSKLYIIYPDDNINNIINQIPKYNGFIFTSGKYSFNKSIQINKDNFIIMGLGWPIIDSGTNTDPIFIINSKFCWINSLILDSGTGNPISLLNLTNIGTDTKLHDIFTRILTPTESNITNKCQSMILIEQNNVYAENLWLWRADHQNSNTDWNRMLNPTGLIVNGNNVIIYGLAVEHQSSIMTLWNGDNGKCLFYQSEFPYNGETTGYPSYVVGDNVNNHILKGGGVYFVVNDWGKNPPLYKIAGKCPDKPNIKLSPFLGSNWGGLTSLQNVIEIGEKVYLPVGENQKVMYCV
jgi:hypothetical protein